MPSSFPHSRPPFAAIAAILVVLSPVFAASPQTDAEKIAAQLSSADAAVFASGVDAARTMIDGMPDEGVAALREHWLQPLDENGHYAQTEDLCLHAILARPQDMYSIEHFQRHRITALLKQGKNAAALAGARSLFNVAAMDATERTILVVAETLNATHPGDMNIARRFQEEEMAGAGLKLDPAFGMGEVASAPATQPAGTRPTPPSAIMRSIAIDAKIYQAALERFDPGRFLIRTRELGDFKAYGNLLLLAGRATEARKVFEQMLDLAVDEPARLQAREGIARSIKAEDGTVGRANAWIESQRKDGG